MDSGTSSFKKGKEKGINQRRRTERRGDEWSRGKETEGEEVSSGSGEVLVKIRPATRGCSNIRLQSWPGSGRSVLIYCYHQS